MKSSSLHRLLFWVITDGDKSGEAGGESGRELLAVAKFAHWYQPLTQPLLIDMTMANVVTNPV
jgi:hypothetical protein